MKKIFTLLFALGFLVVANAQTGSRDTRTHDARDNQQYDQRADQQNGQWDNNSGYSYDRDVTRNDDRFSKSNSMEMQVARINHKYDFQIQSVQHDFFMRRYEKMRMIHSLEAQRQQEIRMLYARSGNRNRHHDWDSNRRY